MPESIEPPADFGAPESQPSPSFHDRWVIYLSKDRRVLWVDVDGPDANLPDDVLQARARAAGDNCPVELVGWNELLDLAYSTRMPQYGTKKIVVDGKELVYTLKVFPDLALDGELKGLIQVVEQSEDENWHGDLKKTINAVLDLTLSGVILYSPQRDCVLNVNRRVAQQTGYPIGAFDNMPGKRLFGRTGTAILKKIFQRMSKAGDGMIWGQDLAIHDSYGRNTRYLCSLRAIPERPGPDSPLAMIISLDASSPEPDRPAMLSGPNQMFLMKAVRDSMWEFDYETRRFSYSRAFADLFGPEGLEGNPGKLQHEWAAFVHPVDLENVFQRWRRLLKKGERYSVQYRYRDSQGNWHWILSTIYAILNGVNGRPLRIIGTHVDITESIRTEKDLVDAEERLRLIFDNAGIGIAMADIDGDLTNVNPALALMLGYNQDDFEGRRISEFAHPDEIEDIRAILTRLKSGGRRETVSEKRFLCRDGRQLWVNLTATLSKKALEGDRYVILMVENVTDRHERQVKMQYRATHDVLTGSWNRFVLLERLDQHINLAIRHEQPMAFCICDLDHFKMVNDIHGHQTGDMVLVEFVKILSKAIRDTDVLGRYGGEEFGIVFPSTSVEGARRSMERALWILGEKQFTDFNGDNFRITATFGVSGVEKDSTAKSVIAQADSALYSGKEYGRNRVVVWTPDRET